MLLEGEPWSLQKNIRYKLMSWIYLLHQSQTVMIVKIDFQSLGLSPPRIVSAAGYNYMHLHPNIGIYALHEPELEPKLFSALKHFYEIYYNSIVAASRMLQAGCCSILPALGCK